MYNLVQLIGRLARDTETRVTESGTEIAKGTLAVSRSYKNSEGVYETDFINFTCYGNVGKTLNQYCHKGDLIALRGNIRTDSYTDKEGNKRYTTYVVVEKVAFLSTKPKEDKKETEENQKDPFEEFNNEVVINESDLPF